MVTGIICEYNPLHLGHKKQLDQIRQADPDGSIVCLISGNYVQRGKPAIFHKTLRAKAAIQCGADLVLELPIHYALSSAEGFAAGGVRILSKLCHQLCFGAESACNDALMKLAQALLSDSFPQALTDQLRKGLSFPAARQAALDALGLEGQLLTTPNNILAVEYCKAIISQNSQMKPFPIQRTGNYHDPIPDPRNPSATAIRACMESGGNWQDYVPEQVIDLYANATVYAFEHGEKAILSRLRTMSDSEFEALPYGTEGLWRKFMHECRRQATVQDILSAVKSKRYTRTRLDRMLMCAFLGITQQQMAAPAPYTRVLAFNAKGRQILSAAKKSQALINIGQTAEDPYQVLEDRAGSLYGLFANTPQPPDSESLARVYFQP